MKDPYQTPESALKAPPTSSSQSTALIQLIVGLVCAFIAALAPMLVIPQFRRVFENFGADIPVVTQIALKYHLWLWILPVLVITARLFWPKIQRRPWVSCLVGVISLALAIPLMILAMYLPIFRLGQII